MKFSTWILLVLIGCCSLPAWAGYISPEKREALCRAREQHAKDVQGGTESLMQKNMRREYDSHVKLISEMERKIKACQSYSTKEQRDSCAARYEERLSEYRKGKEFFEKKLTAMDSGSEDNIEAKAKKAYDDCKAW